MSLMKGKNKGQTTPTLIGQVYLEVRREESCKEIILGKQAIGGPIENSAWATTNANAGNIITNQHKVE